MDPLDQLDLNLLRTLAVLLQERSVTRAARVLSRSQPAVSHALQRLRDAFDDPLLVRQGRGLVLTPRAEQLAAPLERVLVEIRRVVTDGGAFDPGTATRTFVLGCPDLAPVIPLVLAEFRDAPQVRLELKMGIDAVGVDEVDVLLGPMPTAAPGVVARGLGTVRSVVALRRGHPALAHPWTPEAWVAWPHVQVSTGTDGRSVLGRLLVEHGLERTIGVRVGTFLLAAHVASQSDMMFTAAREMLQAVAEPLSLELLEPPLPMPEVQVAALWSERLHADPGHRWFRERVIRVMDSLMMQRRS